MKNNSIRKEMEEIRKILDRINKDIRKALQMKNVNKRRRT